MRRPPPDPGRPAARSLAAYRQMEAIMPVRGLGALALATPALVVLALPAAAQDAPDLDAMRADFESAFNAADSDALVRLYAEDAIVLPPDYGRVEGRDAIARYFSDTIAERQAGDIGITSMEDRRIDGAWLDTGTYSMQATGPDGQPLTLEGDYASLVEQVDGAWAITRHIWNQDMPQGR